MWGRGHGLCAVCIVVMGAARQVVVVVFVHVAWGCGRCQCGTCVVVMVMGAVHWVTVVVFARMAWGCGRCRCGACVAVTVFMPCVVIVGAARQVAVAGAVIVLCVS